MEEATAADVIDAQERSQGVGCIQTADGHVFTFSRHVLEQLLAKAISSATGRVLLVVKHQVPQ